MQDIPSKTAQSPRDTLAAAVEQRLASGKDYWRSLEELCDTPAFRELLRREFPRHAELPPAGLQRREFVRLLAASLALSGLTGCTKQPTEKIAPYVRQPEQVVPGQPLCFATAMAMGGLGTGLLVTSHQGRPTKIEGNPQHPASLGATDLYAQASVLSLYDPDRSQNVLCEGEVSSFADLRNTAAAVLLGQRRTRGSGLHILTDTVSSPTLASQLGALLAQLPDARWHQWEPCNRDAAVLGARLAFGTDVETIYHFERAECVLSLDADFLSCGPGCLRYTRDFARRRRPESGTPVRLYSAHTAPSATAAIADQRLPLRPSEVEPLVRALAAGLGIQPEAEAPHNALPADQAQWLATLLEDLRAHPRTSLILAGDSQPPIVHALAHALNHALQSLGNTVVYIEPVAARTLLHLDSLRELCAELEAGRVDTLVICDASGGCNPAYSAPADLRFADRLGRARLRIHLGPYVDETAALCQWHVPAAHYLESWSDTRAYDGTIALVQPLISPLYDGHTAHELLAAFSDAAELSAYELVRSFWKIFATDPDFEQFWQRALDRGVIPETARPPKAVTLRPLPPATAAPPPLAGLELVFRPEPAVYDGRFANNGWLQELPRPLTRLTWDNVAMLSPRTARELAVGSQQGFSGKQLRADVLELKYAGRVLRAPVWIQPGHPDGCVTVSLGMGRSRAGRVGNGVGYNAYVLRTSDSLWSASGVAARRTGERQLLASTQLHFAMQGRELVKALTAEEYAQLASAAETTGPRRPAALSLYPEQPAAASGYAWGMAIDLSACVGCGACVVACQAENNIPVVGKAQVARGRELHWLRVDHYYHGDAENPQSYFQPVPCMHCENAPCELVCPVAATVHDPEGLNEMIYNRCIGTRYCSNNCPYKVRRFNFLLYWDDHEPSLLQRNPNVTVRSRGVMEKCTYCVQRISAARIGAEEQGRRIRDGELQTACQAVCPAEAIVFGDLNDPHSRVSQLKSLPRSYALLEELNTRPRTTYLAAVRNPVGERRGG